MKLSTDRILTTHVGSLPRSAAVLDLLYRKEQGESYDTEAFDDTVRAAVDDVVRKQVEIGIDVVSDGEMSKVGYATYVKDRLSGFEGHYPRPPHLDLAPYPELRLELDLAHRGWSSLDETSVTFDPDAFRRGPTERTRRDWDDTLSLRLGLEGDVSDALAVFGGVALEPSPVPDGTVEPGFPRADATVYAVGASWSFPKLSFDLGYSFHDYDDRAARGQEPDPAVSGRYSAHDQVWAVSARWRL